MNGKFAINRVETGSHTEGLAHATGYELQLEVRDPQLLDACANLTRFLGEYFSDPEIELRPGDRLDWASALLISRQLDEHAYTFDELSYDGETVSQGVQETVSVWSQQSLVCEEYHSAFTACRYGALIAVSPGLLESCGTVIGTRYPAPSHMSGWWLFTEDYDGSIDGFSTMKPTETFRVLSKRPEIAPLLALNVGFVFRLAAPRSDGVEQTKLIYDVHYEKEIAEQAVP